MIRDKTLWKRFEADWQAKREQDFEANLSLFETLIEHARSMGAWPPKDPMDGIEVDIRLARMVNTYVEKPADASGPGAG